MLSWHDILRISKDGLTYSVFSVQAVHYVSLLFKSSTITTLFQQLQLTRLKIWLQSNQETPAKLNSNDSIAHSQHETELLQINCIMLHTIAECLFQNALQFGMHRSSPSFLNFVPNSQTPLDLSTRNIQRQIAAEWLEWWLLKIISDSNISLSHIQSNKRQLKMRMNIQFNNWVARCNKEVTPLTPFLLNRLFFMQQKVLSVRKGGNWKIWKTYVTSLLHRVAQLHIR